MVNLQFMLGIEAGILIGVAAMYFLYGKFKNQKKMFSQSQNHFVHAIENSKDFIYCYQLVPERKYLYLSPSAECFFGEGSIERAYKDPDMPIRNIHPDDYKTLMCKIKGEVDFSKSIIQRWKDKDGKYRCFEEYTTPIYENGTLVALKGVLRNIDEKIELHKELQYRLSHDALTNIYNRAFFEQKMVEMNEQINVPVAIILCDLDELKFVNDHYGHGEGDLLIKETAGLLNKFSSETILVARIGGDEFAIIMANTGENDVTALVREIDHELKIYNENPSKRAIMLSVGYSFNGTSKGKMTEVLSLADRNMYGNKSQRKQKRFG